MASPSINVHSSSTSMVGVHHVSADTCCCVTTAILSNQQVVNNTALPVLTDSQKRLLASLTRREIVWFIDCPEMDRFEQTIEQNETLKQIYRRFLSCQAKTWGGVDFARMLDDESKSKNEENTHTFMQLERTGQELLQELVHLILANPKLTATQLLSSTTTDCPGVEWQKKAAQFNAQYGREEKAMWENPLSDRVRARNSRGVKTIQHSDQVARHMQNQKFTKAPTHLTRDRYKCYECLAEFSDGLRAWNKISHRSHHNASLLSEQTLRLDQYPSGIPYQIFCYKRDG